MKKRMSLIWSTEMVLGEKDINFNFVRAMTKAIRHISCVFRNISTAFAGNYKTSDKEMIEFQKDVYSERDNSIKQDKINLSSDMVKIRHDLHTALVEYKNQEPNGEATIVTETNPS